MSTGRTDNAQGMFGLIFDSILATSEIMFSFTLLVIPHGHESAERLRKIYDRHTLDHGRCGGKVKCLLGST